eukprot:3078778-Rhodomonas_salina.1
MSQTGRIAPSCLGQVVQTRCLPTRAVVCKTWYWPGDAVLLCLPARTFYVMSCFGLACGALGTDLTYVPTSVWY